MDRCSCGVELRQFWIWRDGNNAPHASAFKPGSEPEGSYYAANPRDALCQVHKARTPRHDVRDAESGEIKLTGRCQAQPNQEEAAS